MTEASSAATASPTAAARPDVYAALALGDPAPWFHQRSASNPRYAFHTAAGSYIVLCFYGSAADPVGRSALGAVLANRRQFDDVRACFFGVSFDPQDEAQARVRDSLPGLRFFCDFDGTIGRLYGVLPRETPAGDGAGPARRSWVVLDPTLRVMAVVPFASDGSDHETLFRLLADLPAPERFAGVELQAPVLYLPSVFEPELCRQLIALLRAAWRGSHRASSREGGQDRRRPGRPAEEAAGLPDRRPGTDQADAARVQRRIVPEILKVHQFLVTRMERYIVACYAAEDGAHFTAHRDNTTKGTAHRRFAVSINLNADFEGGEISFPEYGPRSFKPPPGGAVVFSCSLLHAVSTVTRGRRYAFLPFLYDDAAAKLREQNNAHLGDGVGVYKPGAAT